MYVIKKKRRLIRIHERDKVRATEMGKGHSMRFRTEKIDFLNFQASI